ncbi:hypothetical protein LCGC14_3109780 [marine sediment metagenome]|uniref:Uncharacterized protein n=1 Tax=marine sediment metagenome TaxID=412755 RepID=A0A0F8WUA4_9ZZZZ
MIALSNFLATYIATRTNRNIPVQIVRNALETYKKHLQTDDPETIEWANIEKQLVIALERMESTTHEPTHEPKVEDPCNVAGCPDCNSTGKPCKSCGEFHPSISMCPSHEVRSSRHNSCPTCGKFFWQCFHCCMVTHTPDYVRTHKCMDEDIKVWEQRDKNTPVDPPQLKNGRFA